MVQLSQGESCSVPAGHAQLTVTNTSATKTGYYNIAGDGIAINKTITAGDTQNTAINQNAVSVINSGSAVLDVPAGTASSRALHNTTPKRNSAMKSMRSVNAFAPVSSVNFSVTNSTNGQLGNQAILVFLTPLLNSANYVYAAWQQLTPGEGGSQSFTLNQSISALALSGNNTSNSMAIAPGYVSSCDNPSGLAPVLEASSLSGSVTPQQAGVQNNTNPFEGVDIGWSVNNNLVVQSNIPLTAGAISTFELQTKLYWAVGFETEGPTYTIQQITPMTVYDLTAGTANVSVDVTYNGVTGLYGYAFTAS